MYVLSTTTVTVQSSAIVVLTGSTRSMQQRCTVPCTLDFKPGSLHARAKVSASVSLIN